MMSAYLAKVMDYDGMIINLLSIDIPAPPENQMMSYLIVSSLLSKAENLIVIWGERHNSMIVGWLAFQKIYHMLTI